MNPTVHPVFGKKLCRIVDKDQIQKLIATGKRGVQQVCSGGNLYTAMSSAKVASVRAAGGYVNLRAPSAVQDQPAAAEGEGAAAEAEGAAAEAEGAAAEAEGAAAGADGHDADDEGNQGLGGDVEADAPFQLQHDHPGCCQSEML